MRELGHLSIHQLPLATGQRTLLESVNPVPYTGVWALADSLVFVFGNLAQIHGNLFLRECGWGSNTVYPSVQTEIVNRLLDMDAWTVREMNEWK